MQAVSFSPKNSLALLSCMGIIALLLIGGIALPIWKRNAIVRKIPVITEKLGAFKQLKTLDESLDTRLQDLKSLRPDDITLPVLSPLALREAESALVTIRNMAADAGITVHTLTPEITGGQDSGQTLRLNTKLSGALKNIRQLLVEIIGLGYVQEIETITVKAGENTLDLDLRFLVKTS